MSRHDLFLPSLISHFFSPIASWMRDDGANGVVFIYTPVLVCKFPLHTVGVDDAISATALLYSQFYKMEKYH